MESTSVEEEVAQRNNMEEVENQDFGFKIDAVFSLATEDHEEPQIDVGTNEFTPSNISKCPVKRKRRAEANTCFIPEKLDRSDIKSSFVPFVDIFGYDVLEEYVRRNGLLSTVKTEKPEDSECKNFDVIFAEGASYERGQRKRKANILFKGPDFLANKEDVNEALKQSKKKQTQGLKSIKFSWQLLKQHRTLFYHTYRLGRKSLSVNQLAEIAEEFRNKPAKYRVVQLLRRQVAWTKKKLKNCPREVDIGIDMKSEFALSPPKLEPMSFDFETSIEEEKPPVLEPSLLKDEDSGCSLSYAGRFRKPNKRLQKEYDLSSKKKVAKVKPMKNKFHKVLPSENVTQESENFNQPVPETDIKYPGNKVSQDPNKFNAALNKLAKSQNTKKFFQLRVGDKVVLIPTDGQTMMPKAFVMDAPSAAAAKPATETLATGIAPKSVPKTSAVPDQKSVGLKKENDPDEYMGDTSTVESDSIHSCTYQSGNQENDATLSQTASSQHKENECYIFARKIPDPDKKISQVKTSPPASSLLTGPENTNPSFISQNNITTVVPVTFQGGNIYYKSILPRLPKLGDSVTKTNTPPPTSLLKNDHLISLPISSSLQVNSPLNLQTVVEYDKESKKHTMKVLSSLLNSKPASSTSVTSAVPVTTSASIVSPTPSSMAVPSVPSVALEFQNTNSLQTSLESPLSASNTTKIATSASMETPNSKLLQSLAIKQALGQSIEQKNSGAQMNPKQLLFKTTDGKLVYVVDNSVSPKMSLTPAQSLIALGSQTFPSKVFKQTVTSSKTGTSPVKNRTVSFCLNADGNLLPFIPKDSDKNTKTPVSHVISPSLPEGTLASVTSHLSPQYENMISNVHSNSLLMSSTLNKPVESKQLNPIQVMYPPLPSHSDKKVKISQYIYPKSLSKVSQSPAAGCDYLQYCHVPVKKESQPIIVRMPFISKSSNETRSNQEDKIVKEESSSDRVENESMISIKKEPVDTGYENSISNEPVMQIKKEIVDPSYEAKEHDDIVPAMSFHNEEKDEGVPDKNSETESETETYKAPVYDDDIPNLVNECEMDEKIRKLKEMIRIQKEKVAKLRQSNMDSTL